MVSFFRGDTCGVDVLFKKFFPAPSSKRYLPKFSTKSINIFFFFFLTFLIPMELVFLDDRGRNAILFPYESRSIFPAPFVE